MKRLTPQEKKKLSYERDRRNVYGNSPQAAKKAIPLRKALRNRANRHLANHEVAIPVPIASEGIGEYIEDRLHLKAPRQWRKYRDAPLGEVLVKKLRDRKIMREKGGRSVLVTRIKLNKE